MALNPLDFEWRYAAVDDAAEMRELYNESVGVAGHSPVVKLPTLASVQSLIGTCKRSGYPLWNLRRSGKLVAWVMVRSITWGPEVCARTGDLSLYVAQQWQGQGVAPLVVRLVYADIHRHGFDAVTCWIFSTNRKSLSVARAFRMQKWGHLPGVADFGGLPHDIEIWGVRLDNPHWIDYMGRFEARHARRNKLLFGAPS